jgi:hypothetical protein
VVVVAVVVVTGVVLAVVVPVEVCVLVSVATQAPQVTGHSAATNAILQRLPNGAHASSSRLLLQLGSVTVVVVPVVTVVLVVVVPVTVVVLVVGTHESQRNGQFPRIASRNDATGVSHTLESTPHPSASGLPLHSGTVVVVVVAVTVVLVAVVVTQSSLS